MIMTLNYNKAFYTTIKKKSEKEGGKQNAEDKEQSYR